MNFDGIDHIDILSAIPDTFVKFHCAAALVLVSGRGVRYRPLEQSRLSIYQPRFGPNSPDIGGFSVHDLVRTRGPAFGQRLWDLMSLKCLRQPGPDYP
jgi:hypothetical protein